MMLCICVKFHQNTWNSFQLTERTGVHSPERFFSISTMFKGKQLQKWLTSYVFFSLLVVSWCFTFERNFIISRTVFNLQSGHEYMVEMAMFNVQRAITPKVGKAKL